ncbi:hypothetical protein FDP41_006903 [Naegleria fowleri]|uniref:HD domain-containing protein n=1 Tax=Naegleria fowleri TaxID=5763 RepID=A0A6A5B739_NAEFO|nr:uncharacterized protein FDP41_007004 [Naegleria fowleri]XP_044559006.1 uncharacterized protein FDP41_006903 [Naegleria fowleri]KAF0973972.1 hypothetical protein FDP41_007004 [Naegleria fowleri]KAF0974293.1 hypothetical protein FDP41_006903 [Naegleria fowleri]
MANYEGVYRLVHEQLQALDKDLFYHNIGHTFEDVLPASILLAKEEGLNEEDLLIVKTAALFHDTGYLDQYSKNEPKGCERARQYLPQFGYSEEQIEKVCKCIMATMVPQNPGDCRLCQIVCDADLGHLGTDLYFLKSECLRLELERVYKKPIAPRDWHISNLDFLQKHQYFTNAAKKLMQPVKEQNYKLNECLVYGENK